MNYKILTDSCCDFPSGMYEQLDLAMVPLSVEFQGKVYDDKNDDSLKELYSGLRCGDAAKTSAVNPARPVFSQRNISSYSKPFSREESRCSRERIFSDKR